MSPDFSSSRITDLNHRAISLRIGTHSSDIINWGYIGPEYWRNYLHTHSFHEVCFAFAGRGTFQIQGQQYDVEAGDLFIAKPGEPHEIISSHDQPLGIYFWAFTLLPPEDGAPAKTGADALLTAYRWSRRWVSNRVTAVSATLDLLEDEVERNAPGNTEAIEGLVVKLLLDTCRSVVDRPIPAEDAPLPHHAPAEQIADRIARYLQDNYAGSVTVRDVAAQVHLSERHTNRLFRGHAGTDDPPGPHGAAHGQGSTAPARSGALDQGGRTRGRVWRHPLLHDPLPPSQRHASRHLSEEKRNPGAGQVTIAVSVLPNCLALSSNG